MANKESELEKFSFDGFNSIQLKHFISRSIHVHVTFYIPYSVV